jgi:hypothetical protein
MPKDLCDHIRELNANIVENNKQVSILDNTLRKANNFSSIDSKSILLWEDAFEGTKSKWNHTFVGAGSGISIQTDYANTGSQGIELVAGDDVAGLAKISRVFYLDNNKTYGIEIDFMSYSLATPEQVIIKMTLVSPENTYNSKIIYDRVTKNIKILNNSGVDYNEIVYPYYSFISGYEHLWNNIKMTVNFSGDISKASFYKDIFINNIKYDTGNTGIYLTGGDTQTRGLYIEIICIGTTGKNSDIIIDNVKLTEET